MRGEKRRDSARKGGGEGKKERRRAAAADDDDDDSIVFISALSRSLSSISAHLWCCHRVVLGKEELELEDAAWLCFEEDSGEKEREREKKRLSRRQSFSSVLASCSPSSSSSSVVKKGQRKKKVHFTFVRRVRRAIDLHLEVASVLFVGLGLDARY